MEDDEDALLAAAIELSLREATPASDQGTAVGLAPLDPLPPQLPLPLSTGSGDQQDAFTSVLASLRQALSQPAVPQEEGVKMVLCVRRDLGMTTGKIAAQCSHATLGLYKLMVAHHARLLEEWEDSHYPKIALKLDDEKQMLELQQKASSLGLPVHIVMDAGKTQIARGSRTVLAIAGKKSMVDSVTGHLKLL